MSKGWPLPADRTHVAGSNSSFNTTDHDRAADYAGPRGETKQHVHEATASHTDDGVTPAEAAFYAALDRRAQERAAADRDEAVDE